jgi:hypothetical protein
MLGAMASEHHSRDWEAEYRDLLADIEREFPGFRIIRKVDSRFQRAIHYGLMVVTFGQMREYLDGYQTTIRYRVYVTDDWDEHDARDRIATMRHERVHLRQFRRYTFVGMTLLYLLVPLPLGLAYFRARFEREAYEETLAAQAEIYGIDYIDDELHRDCMIDQFTSAAYGWMWPFRRRMESWYDRVLARLKAAEEARGQ